MKKIIFFTETKWAFGNIHNSLSRVLFSKGLLCDVLDWSISRNIDDFSAIDNNTDYYVTTPSAVVSLLSYGIDPKKIIAIAHGEIDILIPYQSSNNKIFDTIHKYAVVSDWLKTRSQEIGISRIPEIVKIGIDVERYFSALPEKLESVSCCGTVSAKDFYGNEIKRGYLIKKCCEIVGLKFLETGCSYHYIGMPSFYRKSDCVMMASTQETVSLPMLEGAAAGRMVMGTPVGYISEFNHGFILPMDETAYVKKASEILDYFKNNPVEFKKECLKVRNFAIGNFGWEKHINDWISLFN